MGADPTGSANGTVPILKVRGLSREFRGFRAVDGVDLDVAEGSVHALVGPERRRQDHPVQPAHRLPEADRRAASRWPIAGSVTGLPPGARSPGWAWPARSRSPACSPQLTAARARRAGAGQRHRPGLAVLALGPGAGPLRRARGRNCSTRSGSPTRPDVPADSLPYGRKRALELALALALDPKVLLLDEPTAGMGVEDVDRTVELIGRVRAGRTVVLVEHNMNVVGRPRRPGHRAAGRQGPGRGPVRRGPRTTRGSSPPTWETPMLRIDGLSAWYGEAQALREVSPARSTQGEIVTLVGRNGAGKTTLLRCVMGLHARTAARARSRWSARTSPAWPAHRRARRGLGCVPDDRGIYATLSVEENLHAAARQRPARSRGRWSGCTRRSRRCASGGASPGTKLSGGEQQMLALARVLRMGARLLLCDEPTEGLSPLIVQQIGEILREVKAAGRDGPAGRAERALRRRPSPTGTTCSPRAGSSSRWTTPRSATREHELLDYLGI